MATDGRTASKPYRVRAGGIWYWVDPTVPREAIDAGDTVVIYPVTGEPALAILQSRVAGVGGSVSFSSLEGEAFEVASQDIAAMHLTAVDETQ